MQNFHQLELTWLKDCIVLAEKRNFSQAAKIRYVTQSAFSRRIQALEGWVGTPLFVRNQRSVQLTEAGEVFCAKAPELLRLAEQLRNQAQDAARLYRSDVVIAATHLLSFSFFPDLLRRNDKIAHFGSFRLLSDTLQMGERILLQGEAQFLLSHAHPYMPSNLDPEQFVSIVLGNDRLLPYTKADEQGKALWQIETGKPFPYLSFSQESGIGRILSSSQALNPLRKMMDKVFIADLATTLLAMVRAGEGVAWLPEILAEADVRAGNLTIASQNPAFWLPIDICLYRPKAKMGETAELLWEILCEEARS